MDKEIKVSISCLVYNHEKYIKKCLDGLLMQKTNFRFEILIHDDASTDKSADIIREYEVKYPDVIKPIYQTENQYSKGVKISFTYQYPRARGKYIAFCEGDDYWCDENKLQLQYEKLEKNPKAVFCGHKVECITEEGRCLGRYYPTREINKEFLSSDEMMKILRDYKYPFQTSCYFIRANLLTALDSNNTPKFMYLGGDLMCLMYLLTQGDYIYIDRVMSCYRNNSIGSWSERNKGQKKQVALAKNTISAYLLFDIYTNQIYSEVVRQIIEQELFYIYQVKKDYRMLCNRQFRRVFKQLTYKNRLYYHLCVFFPWIEKVYSKYMRRNSRR